MTDPEIKKYLYKNNYAVNSQDGVMDILNTSKQIIDTNYSFDTGIITIKTPENTFTFKWILGKF